MNKELYIRRENGIRELRKLSYIVNSLQDFIIKNEKYFKREESIETLKKIKEYLKIRDEEYRVEEEKQNQITKEFYSTCKHEVAIKESNIYSFYCLICNEFLGPEIPKESLIVVDTSEDYKVARIIKKTFEDVVHSDKDLIETISDVIEDMQYERDIKVYRRSR